VKRLADQTLYEILEVPADAPAKEIEAACDRARSLYGPGSLATYTLMTPDEAALLTSRIEDARGTLLDPEARARYDEALLRRSGEARAAAGGAGTSTPFPSLPPVIPAVQPGGGAAREGGSPALPPSEARPAIPLGTVLDASSPPGSPRPILLQREVPGREDSPAAPQPAAAAPAGGPAFPAPPIPEAWTGEALRQVREARGISVQQVAERTKVTRHHIENIEADRFGALPAPVYLRGILLAIARELRLDGQKVSRSYLDRLAGAAPPPGSPRAR